MNGQGPKLPFVGGTCTEPFGQNSKVCVLVNVTFGLRRMIGPSLFGRVSGSWSAAGYG